MKRKFVFVLSLLVLSSLAISSRFSTVQVKASDSIDTSKIYGVQMLWNSSMMTNDVAVSKDANYLAAVNNTGVFYFAYDNSTPRWWYLSSGASLSVAVSADGEYVVTGSSNGYLYYFNNSRTMTGERPSPTWTSTYLYGSIQRRTLDMSDDGEYIIVGGTGTSVYYFAQCRTRSGSAESPTWSRYLPAWEVFAVDMSPDGKCVAAGGSNSSNGFVIFYDNASGATPPYAPTWDSWSSMNGSIRDLAVSDDGYSVVAVDGSNILYWANATNLAGNPNATWSNQWTYTCVDMSVDGDNVVAGGDSPQIVHFWPNARERKGTQAAEWTRFYAPYDADDVAISDDGGIIAATIHTDLPDYKALFFKSDSSLIIQFDLAQYSPLVSMSGNGLITAMAGPGWDSLNVYKMMIDSTPPLIENVHQQPASDSVYPDSEVMVYANVTDDESGVKRVILNYTSTTDVGIWTAVNMTNLEGNLYNGTIPQFPYCTNVTWVIIAIDNFNNTITTEEMQYLFKYHVVPEFPSPIILPLFAMTTLLTAIAVKKKTRSQTKKEQ